MRLPAACLLLAGAMLACAPAAAEPTAEPAAPRLSRPVSPAATGADGKLEMSGKTTFGNLVVEQHATVGRIFAANPNGNSLLTGLKPTLCDGATGAIAAYAAKEVLKRMTQADRARVKSKDAAALTDLAIGTAAVLDAVSPEAIRADEALGPGAYHDAISGFRIAFVACRFYGAL